MAADRKSRRQSGNDRPQPREFGRDGVSGLVTQDRALRAREVSRPQESDVLAVQRVLDQLLARAAGRRR